MNFVEGAIIGLLSNGIGGCYAGFTEETSSSKDPVSTWRNHLVSREVVLGTGVAAAASLAYFIYWLRSNDADLRPIDFIQHDAFFLDHPEIQEFREKLIKRRVPHFRFLDWATGASLAAVALGTMGMFHTKVDAPEAKMYERMSPFAMVTGLGLVGLILNRTAGYRITQNKYINWMLKEVDKEIKEWTPNEDTTLLPEITIEIFETEKKNFERVKEQIREALLALSGRTHIVHGLPIRYDNKVRISKKYEKLANLIQYDKINVDQMRYIWEYTAGKNEKLSRAEKLHRVSWGLCLLSAIQTIKIRCNRLERMAHLLQERYPEYDTGIAGIRESAEGRQLPLPQLLARDSNEQESLMHQVQGDLPPLVYPQHYDQSLLYSQQPSMQPLAYEQQQPMQPLAYQQQQPIQPLAYQPQMQKETSYPHTSLRSGQGDDKQREESPNYYKNEYYPQGVESNA